MMLEIDGILRAQARHNLIRLNILLTPDILKRACLALLALHLFHFDLHFADTYPPSWFPGARELATTPQDLDPTPESGENDGSSVGKVGSIQLVESIDSQQVLQRYIHKIYTTWRDGLCKLVEAVGGQRKNPSDFISRENLWKSSLCLHHLSTRSHHSPVCNSQHLSEALTSINNCLREFLNDILQMYASLSPGPLLMSLCMPL